MSIMLIRPRMRAAAVALGAVLFAPAVAIAQDTVATACTVRSHSAAVVVMTCESRFDRALWRAEAAKACGERMRCNVWIWDDASKAPEKAPVSDAELPKDVAAQAVAIWVHDSQSFVSLRRVPGK